MAKQRKRHSIMEAIEAVVKAEKAGPEEKKQAYDKAMAVIKDSNFAALAENADEKIENAIVAEEEAEEAAAQAEEAEDRLE